MRGVQQPTLLTARNWTLPSKHISTLSAQAGPCLLAKPRKPQLQWDPEKAPAPKNKCRGFPMMQDLVQGFVMWRVLWFTLKQTFPGCIPRPVNPSPWAGGEVRCISSNSNENPDLKSLLLPVTLKFFKSLHQLITQVVLLNTKCPPSDSKFYFQIVFTVNKFSFNETETGFPEALSHFDSGAAKIP